MMKTLSPVPHDGLFKTFLTNTDTARDFLSFYLPPELLEICDITTLQLESGSFIEENLRTYFADVLYSLRTSNGTGYIYTLIEHQSSSDKHMAFRLMRYAIAAMQRHIEAGHTALPLVVPLLFCHGRATPWPYTTDWTALFAEPELARRLYTRSFPLIDVGAMDDADIMKHRRMAMLELLLKHARTRDLAELTEQLVTLLLAGYTTNEQLVTSMNWMMQTGTAGNPEKLLQELTSHLSSQEDVLMTIAEYLEQKGLTKGLQKGRTEGEREATLKIARALLQNGIAPDTVSKTTGLSEQELTSLSQANPTA
ncbi:Rpn family recombination-promoting nuclease/putative transposase [Erwinia sp. ACCC 02193]|jgi:predicted transposase/invertase (TIGR01784 family)|uniref:Rpn family recombination-promoting nuclease/putative transposase n=1 Tax=Erwinia aeris TaxID=3239803 RepID=A0ABV4E6M8_9GAMM|nr:MULTISPECIES: Rpn family recombination-promoting nuclease/putative transposase [unclassified Erwinia]MDN4628162.1 Rpn family recombination-promoting nuclease/putative transposase [Erwinia sp. PsM31]MDN8541890.1 Rpn family recombination-promoting nuclease/putative transposase [Erwinia sp. BC051422]